MRDELLETATRIAERARAEHRVDAHPARDGDEVSVTARWVEHGPLWEGRSVTLTSDGTMDLYADYGYEDDELTSECVPLDEARAADWLAERTRP